MEKMLTFELHNLDHLRPFSALMDHILDGWRIKSVSQDEKFVYYRLEK